MANAQKIDATMAPYVSDETKKALTDLALEGIYPSDDLRIDMSLLDAGKLSKEEFLQRAIKRAKS